MIKGLGFWVLGLGFTWYPILISTSLQKLTELKHAANANINMEAIIHILCKLARDFLFVAFLFICSQS